MNNQVTVVVAVTDQGRRLEQCVQALSSSFNKILLVSPPDNPVIRKAKSLELQWVTHDSREVQALWKVGIEKSSTPWILLLRSNEIAPALLKENILDKVENGPAKKPTLFPLKLTTIFLKKRTKYPLIWKGEPPSALVYIHPDSAVENVFSISPKKQLKGDLFSFREETVVETFSSSLELAEDRADRLFRTRPGLSKTPSQASSAPQRAVSLGYGKIFPRSIRSLPSKRLTKRNAGNV